LEAYFSEGKSVWRSKREINIEKRSRKARKEEGKNKSKEKYVICETPSFEEKPLRVREILEKEGESLLRKNYIL